MYYIDNKLFIAGIVELIFGQDFYYKDLVFFINFFKAFIKYSREGNFMEKVKVFLGERVEIQHGGVN